MTSQEIIKALQKAYKKAGTQSELSEQAGISQGRISDYLCGRREVGNMTVSTLIRLFPEMVVFFFTDELPEKSRHNTIDGGGKVSGTIVQNGSASTSASDLVSLKDLSRKIRKSSSFSAEERLKILDFLDEEL